MKRLLNATYGWILFLVLIIVINLLASLYHYRLDLTAEKRYTLSKPVIEMLDKLEDRVTITVFLAGEMPAGFKKLANSTQELLQEFKKKSKVNIQYHFTRAGEGMDENVKGAFLDSIARLGIKPYTIKAQIKEGEGSEERQVVPGALISYKKRVIAVDLLEGQNVSMGLDEATINSVEAILEYKLATAIQKITSDTLPLIGYLTGNGESLSYNVYSLIETILRPNYAFRILPIDSVATIPPIFSAIMIVKPVISFTDQQKIKIDQYIMHGGKVIWMIDRLYAEMDSLQRVQNEFIAFDRGLNLDDVLFKYGVRINPDLVQDKNCDQIASVVGNAGGKPQMELLHWPYSPLLQNNNGHPIAKNLGYIVSQFPNSIDTVQAEGIHKIILLTTSRESRILSTPAKVMLQSIKTEEDLRKFNQGNIPVAVLLEGKFSSLYTNRLSPAVKDSIQFLPSAVADNKMIVIADGDMALNTVSQNEGPLPMGMNMFTKYQYANKEFISNCLEYLTGNSGILEARSKDYTLRLLDKKKIAEEKSRWQIINILAPLLLVIVFGVCYQLIRKNRYRK